MGTEAARHALKAVKPGVSREQHRSDSSTEQMLMMILCTGNMR